MEYFIYKILGFISKHFLDFLLDKTLVQFAKNIFANNNTYIHKCNKVSPTDVMRERGKIECGFKENVWLERQGDKDIIEYFNRDNTSIVTIVGRYAAGKSRMVYQYLHSNKCKFKYAFIPEGMNVEAILEEIKNQKKNNIIIVLDDINQYLSERKAFCTLLRTVHEDFRNNCKIICTLSTPYYEDYKKILKEIKENSSVSDRYEYQIIIPDIEMGDDVYCFCKSNLKNDGFSIVIGGYIPETTRDIQANINKLSSEAKKLIVTYHIARRYRHNYGKRKDSICSLHNKLFPESNATETLFKELTDCGVLRQQDDSYNICNKILYDELIAQLEKTHKNIYLSKNSDTEIKLVKKYLETADESNKENSTIIILTRLLLRVKEHQTIEFLKNITDNKIKETITSQIISGEDKEEVLKDFVNGPISCIVSNKYYKTNKIELVEKYIKDFNIKPNDNLIGSLLKSVQSTPDEWEAQLKYVHELKERYQININSLFYYAATEQITIGYSEERINNVVTLYKASKQNDAQARYAEYCGSLLLKANNKENIDKFFNILKNMEVKMALCINMTPHSIYQYLKHVCSKMLLEYFCINLFENFEAINFIHPSLIDEQRYEKSIIRISYLLVEESDDFTTAKKIYDIVFQKVENYEKTRSKVTLTENSFNKTIYLAANTYFDLKNMLGIKLLEKSNSNDIEICRNIILNSIYENTNSQCILKQINTHFSHLPSYEDIECEQKILKNNGWNGDIGIDTICIMLQKLKNDITESKEIDLLNDKVKKIYDIIAEKNNKRLIDTPYYCTILYTIIKTLIDKKFDTNEIDKIKKNIPSQFNDNEICFSSRIATITNFGEFKQLIENIINKVTNKEAAIIIPDIVSNTICQYLRFNQTEKEQLRVSINKLIDNYPKEYRDIFFYRQLFNLKLKELIENNNLRIWVEETHKQLEKNYVLNYKLEKSKKDNIYSWAIENKKTPIELAMDLLTDVINSSSRDNEILTYCVCSFIKRLGNEKQDIKNKYMQKTQDLINNNRSTFIHLNRHSIITKAKNARIWLNIPDKEGKINRNKE